MKPRLYLVDAHAYLHRAYHALPPLTNSKGEPVGALYGFARTLIQILKRDKPEALAVCFDTPGPTFRHKAYDQYKATRKEIDGDLITQLGQARPLAESLGFKCIEAPGFEADDIMATMARKAVKHGWDAVLVTGDKDALQLVGEGVRVFNISKGQWMDPPQIEEKFGIPPSAVRDYLAIVGDASDNVPGLKGVGPVGAVKLIKDLDHPVEGKNVLIVEDILDTGLTLSYLRKIILQHHPKTLRIAALLDKPSRRLEKIEADYVGFSIPNLFVIGYGMDYAERYRNLPDICLMSPDHPE